ncbi:MetQ/NlpA family ABC transporter substrate-binding protein [Spongiactinospora sp. 9N601]|uniref:MetQ/NlpA family ABC transporter substrate-binding protein n=1 Tax=Spongiactinospora sp. 9N601 TaxID=3375149 RepID=UPI0037BDC133
MRRFLGGAAVAVLTLVLAACGGGSGEPAAPAADGTVKIGASPTPHAQILTFVRDKLATAAGLKLEIVEFTDYVQPNTQLQEGKLDANYFQHKPYLDDFVASKGGAALTYLQPVHLEPLGLYSRSVKSLGALPAGASIAVPNDATNLGRALKLLQDNGLITLKEGAGTAATERDVAGNPKKFTFKPLEAAQLPRSLQDVDAAVINGNYALEAGLKPAGDGLALEKAEGNPYANGLVVRTDQKDDADLKKLAGLLAGPEVAKYIKDTFGDGAVIPAQT